MPDLTERKPPPGLARQAAWLLCGLWLLAGITGHGPWKADDALHLGVAWSMAGSDWLVPRIAGEPWLASPPLYHWLATICGKLLGSLLPWHDAARLATALFGAGFLFALSRTALLLHGPHAAVAAPLLAVGTLGLLVPMHEAQPAIAACAGFGLGLWGLAAWRAQPLHGGAAFGAGIGVAFLAAGLGSGLVVAAAGVVLFHPEWRRQATRGAWLVIAAATALLVLPWPLLLWKASPALFEQWWLREIDDLTGHGAFSLDHVELLGWAAWPVLPLSFWGLWLEQRRLHRAENLLLLAAATTALALFLADSPRPSSLLPALVPLTLLGTVAAGRLRRGAASAFDWFGMMTFTLIAGLIWLGGIAMLTGEPARVAKNFSKPAPGFVAEASPLVILLAIAVSVAWIAVMLRTPRSPWRAAARWSAGLATIWLLLALLWMPWIDHGKSYRHVAAELRQTLGVAPGCIARRNLGLPQRAALDYHAGIRTLPHSQAASCRWMLVQATPPTRKEIARWTLVRESFRPGDKGERLRLYRRDYPSKRKKCSR